ncbi:MAG: hypothetical protein ACRENL_04675 [Candidatus Dormibacteria bacterium]
MTFSFDPNQSALGDYAITIYGVGNVSGTVPLLRTGPTTGIVDADSVAAKFSPPGGSSPQPTKITMDGAVDLTHSAAGFVFTLLGQQYSLVDYVPSSSLAPVQAAQMAALVVRSQWSLLYGMLSAEERQQVSQAAFTASMTSQSAGGPAISQITLNGSGTRDNHNGVVYWHQPLTVTATPSGGTSHSYSSVLDLVAQGGQWRLVDITNPVAS